MSVYLKNSRTCRHGLSERPSPRIYEIPDKPHIMLELVFRLRAYFLISYINFIHERFRLSYFLDNILPKTYKFVVLLLLVFII